MIKRRFRRTLETYASEAVVQQRIAARLARLVADHLPDEVRTVLEVGCGTGFLTRELLRRIEPEKFYLNDLVPEGPDLLRDRIADGIRGVGFVTLPGDAEELEFPAGLDAVLSASTVQWFDDLPGFFARAARALNPGGVLAFSTFGDDNLLEIRQLTGMGLDYPAMDNLRRTLDGLFQIRILQARRMIRRFSGPFDVLRHLQRTGVTVPSEFRWTREALARFEEDYRNLYSRNGAVILTWQPVYVIAVKK